jgi:tetraacyldisaccharide 4'-kinase
MLIKPLSLIVEVIIRLRHFCYDSGFFSSKKFDQPIIIIGNLSFGGTGKTPLVLALAEYIQRNHKVFILSRGYGRKSKESIEVECHHKANIVGDEPLLMKRANPSIRVVVSNDRLIGIDMINKLEPNSKVIICDDALQHRRLSGGHRILLTTARDPFYQDALFPFGKLRDIKSRAGFVDSIVISKTNSDIDQKDIKQNCFNYSNAEVFFSKIQYGDFYSVIHKKIAELQSKVVIVSAIANSNLFREELERNALVFHHFEYRDHYSFTNNDFKDWIDFSKDKNINQIILTEKDLVKMTRNDLELFESQSIDLIALPIQTKFIGDDSTRFFAQIDRYINNYV